MVHLSAYQRITMALKTFATIIGNFIIAAMMSNYEVGWNSQVDK